MITDPNYKLEQEYKRKGIPYSPFLLHPPSELLGEIRQNMRQEDDGYYKTFILIDDYDECPESDEETFALIEKNKNEEGEALAYTNWFDMNGEKSLKRCYCLGYIPKEKLFSIRIPNGDKGEVRKDVTRYNILFESEEEIELERRKTLSIKWKNMALKYYALSKFIERQACESDPEFFSEDKIKEIAHLAFGYRGQARQQFTPIEVEELENWVRCGIYRRNSRKREFTVTKPLNKILKCETDLATEFFIEAKENYAYAQKITKFYSELPYSLQKFMILNEILPTSKFLISAERFLLPVKAKGYFELPRDNEYLGVWRKTEGKLHTADRTSFKALYKLIGEHFEKFTKKQFFKFNFRKRQVTKESFLDYSKNNIMNISREVKSAVLFTNERVSTMIDTKIQEVQRFNKEAECSLKQNVKADDRQVLRQNCFI